MKTPQAPDLLNKAYWKFRRIHSHYLLLWGYQQAKPQILKTDKEDNITGFICEAIDQILLSSQKQWFADYEVHEQKPIPSSEHSGPARRKTDIIIRFLTEQHRPQYVFEAKPLNYPKKYQRTSNYLHKDHGLGRFIKGEYADHTANYPEVAMLGYVLSDTPKLWQTRLKKAILKKTTQLQLQNPPQDIEIIVDLPFEWISQHNRDSNHIPLTIYHILLDCHNP